MSVRLSRSRASAGDGHPERTGEVFRVLRVGSFEASTGPIVITSEHLDAAVAAFNRVVAEATANGGEPPYPPVKVDHIDLPATRAAGLVKALWREGDWLMGEVGWSDAELAAQVATGGLSRASAEVDFDVEVYGEPFAARLVSLALLPGETLPAIAGAGTVRVVASAGQSSMRVRLTCEDEPERRAASAADETNPGGNMEEKLAAMLQQITEGLASLATTVNGLVAKVDSLISQREADAKAAKAEAEEKKAEETDLAAFAAKLKAAQDSGRVTEGEAAELTEVAKVLPRDGRARLAATLEKRPAAETLAEKISNGKAGEALRRAAEKTAAAHDLIRAKLAATPGCSYPAAVLAARAEKPELFAEDEKEGK